MNISINGKKVVAQIEYYDYLPTGSITIGSKTYEDQDFDVILGSLGYSRTHYTYTFETINRDEEDMVNTCMLYILDKGE